MLGYGERPWADVVDGMAGCAHLGKTDLSLPRAAPPDLVAKRNLPCTPDPWGIRRNVPGQPGCAVDVDADVVTAQHHVHAVPPPRLERLVHGERWVAVRVRS